MIILYLILSTLILNDSIEEIHFGKGGGVAGIINHYILDKEGSLYKYNPFTKEKSFLKKVDSLTLTKIFEDEGLSKIRNLKINKPSNTYKFVQLVSKDNTQKLVWSGKTPNNSLHLFYRELNQLLHTKE